MNEELSVNVGELLIEVFAITNKFIRNGIYGPEIVTVSHSSASQINGIVISC